MEITFGKHKGKSVGTIVLKEPQYALWILSVEDPGEPLAHIQKEVQRLIKVFDSKRFVCRCFGCGRTATRFSLAFPAPSAYWWCDDCNPRSMGCDGLMAVEDSYHGAMRYASLCLRKDHTKKLIRAIAEAKELPKRVGEKQTKEFFKKF